MVNWIKSRMKERTSWDGAVCVALGLMILFMAPLAKIAAGLAIFVCHKFMGLNLGLKLNNK